MHVLSGGGISIVAQNDDGKNLLAKMTSRITNFINLIIIPYIFLCALL
jgi:hypothetical protein